MVVLGGGLFLVSEAPLHTPFNFGKLLERVGETIPTLLNFYNVTSENHSLQEISQPN